jgi:hypothetical protein
MLLATALLPIACAATTPAERPSPASAEPTRLISDVSAWAMYEHDGVQYLHLWSPGQPKSVFVIRAQDAEPGFLDTLQRELPCRSLAVELDLAPGTFQEAPTYVRSASILEQEQIVNGVSHKIPATHGN